MKALLFITFFINCWLNSGVTAKTQEFFIAAVETNWHYLNLEPAANERSLAPEVQKYVKAVYNEFTDSTFCTQKTKPPWAGIQGPTIRVVVNDRVVIHFKNFASQPLSISPIGVPYWKQSEGAGYEDSTSAQEQEDDAVQPGGYYKYVWDIHPNSGPAYTDPECLTYSYSSQVNVVRDFNSGLIGALLICKSGVLTEERQRKVPEFVLLFAVFDESKSWYREVGRADKPRKSSDRQQFHTINGFINSTLPGLKLCQKSPEVSWHLIGLGSTPDIHTIQFQEHTLKVMDHRRVIVDITPMTFTTALLKPYTEGRFLISCKIHSHQQDYSVFFVSHQQIPLYSTVRSAFIGTLKTAGMSAFFTVENCPETNELPIKQNGQNTEDQFEDEDYQMDDLFSIVLAPGGPPSVLRSSWRGGPKTWVHYIAAEEVTWDYNPQADRTQAQRMGKVYKKVTYVEYTDKTFTVKKSKSSSLVGPELRGEVNDQFQIIFKNMASRPFNIYPNGLASVRPLKKTGQQVDLRSLAVPPGEIMMYLWKVTVDDAPTDSDPRCLTHLYQSTVNPERDMASGLIGPLIICKSESLDKRGKVVTSDREKHLLFSVFDENKSWYFEENIRKLSEDPAKIRNDPRFYSSNIMYSVNGFMYNSLQFKMCVGDVILWHVANVGMQNDFLSVYFTGNPFEKDKTYSTVLTLFPMTGDTVTTEMETVGEWEISAFDPTLKSRGMSVRYSVFNCERVLPLVDNEDYEYEFEDYVEKNFLIPRGFREKNLAVPIRICKKLSSNITQSDLSVGQQNNTKKPVETEGGRKMKCRKKLFPVEEIKNLNIFSEGEIPQDILNQLDMEMSKSSSSRQKRHAENDTQAPTDHLSEWTDENETEANEIILVEDNQTLVTIASQKTVRHKDVEVETADLKKSFSDDLLKKILQMPRWNTTSNTNEPAKPNLVQKTQREAWSVKKEADQVAKPNGLSDNDVLKDSVQNVNKMVESLDPHKYPNKDQKFDQRFLAPSSRTFLHNQTYPQKPGSSDYDDYEDEGNKTTPGYVSIDDLNMRSPESKFHSYYIAAEEIMWDYGIDKPPQLISPREMKRGKRKYFSAYRKVVYRAYHDKDFQNPVKRGELEEHLGIMGPVLKAEVNDVLTVVFKNLASRPYSLHLHGVYDKTMGTSVSPGSTIQDGEVPGDPVPPGQERVYNWRITKRQGPSSNDFDCKAGAYYSTVNMEKDINSGLIGPLLICRPGTLQPRYLLQPGVQDLFLLFTIFDERKSWYLDYNIRKYCTPPCQAEVDDPRFETNNKFAAINGYIAESLPGLVLAQHQTARWHLLNVGSKGEFHAVHFHGIPFSIGKDQEHRMGVFSLYPGAFGSVETRPHMVGTWLVECTIGEHQLSGMRAKLLVYNPQCVRPLGMQSGWIEDDQITESDHYGNWEARLARLHLSGSVNAWIGNSATSWIQVDLLRPMVLHGIQTQGAKTSMGLKEMFTVIFTISYSLDQKTWRKYRGNSSESEYKFNGNMDSYRIKENLFSPPIIGRYIRIHPFTYGGRPTLRFELLGCDLNSCSLPLGMQRRLISDNRISASSFLKNWRLSWSPHLARLNQEGHANAWRPMSNNPYEWLQVDFEEVKRITGIITQGAKSMLKHMMVTEFTVSVSDNGQTWTTVTEQGTQQEKILEGNSEHDEQKLNILEPPLFTRYIRIHPRGWLNDVALRVEFLGCQTQQRL